MCGIAGIIGLEKSFQVDASLLKAMTDVIEHRGPDDEGQFIEGNIGLGHRRLSIVDLSKNGHQPMTNKQEDIWIVFNGEVYNYQDYVPKLKKLGYEFHSNTDTEMILHAYNEWGIEGCLERLNGMFAFAIWDKKRDQFFIARDRLGIKPVFYTEHNGALVFGSEIKNILVDKSFKPEIDLDVLSHYLTLFYTVPPQTIVKGIQQLEPGYYLSLNEGKVTLKKYWDVHLSSKPQYNDESEILEHFKTLFDKSVKYTLHGDVPIGHLLSSGVDSNAILHYMNKNTLPDNSIYTFTVDSDVKSYSEGDIATHMAKLFDTKHLNYIITPQSVREDLKYFVWNQDHLSGNSACIGMHFLFKLLKETGIKVGLMGSGPDELFAGYETYLADLYASYIRKGIFKPAVWMGKQILNKMSPSFEFVSTDYKLRKLLEGASFSPEKSHYWWRTILVDQEKEQLFKPELHSQFKIDSYYTYEKYFDMQDADQFSFLDRTLYADLKMFLGHNALMLADGASMAHSIEARPSLLNHEMVEFAFKLPSSMKMRGKQLKYIMRKSMEGVLPKDFLSMPKKGMNLPISYWIENELKDLISSILSKERCEQIGLFDYDFVQRLIQDHLDRKSNNMYKIWNLVMFFEWYDLFINRKGFED